jgi:hypothetical protein
LGGLGRDRTFLAYHKYQSDQFWLGPFVINYLKLPKQYSIS